MRRCPRRNYNDGFLSATAINRGIVSAIIVIFLELIGFTVTYHINDWQIGRDGPSDATDPLFLIIFLDNHRNYGMARWENQNSIKENKA